MNQPPRLLVLSSTYPRWKNDPEPGFVHELARRLTDRFDVHVICPHSRFAKSGESLDGVNVHRYKYAFGRLENLVHGGGILANLQDNPSKWLLVAPFLASQLLATYRAVKKLNPDVVHAHWIIPQGVIYSFVAGTMRSPPPMVLTSHGADLFGLQSRLLGRLKRFAMQKAARGTVVSQTMTSKAVELGIAPDRISVASMGVDFDTLFTPGNRESRSRNELLFVGRLVEKKGLPDLLESLAYVVSERPDTILNIAGYGPLENKMVRLVEDKGLTNHVNFLGATPQADLVALYRRSALMIASFVRSKGGDQDGLGLVVIEAIACECPVLVSDLPFVHDILDPETDARFLAPAGAPKVLSKRILECLENQHTLATEVRSLRDRLARKFSWNAVADRYKQILESAAGLD